MDDDRPEGIGTRVMYYERIQELLDVIKRDEKGEMRDYHLYKVMNDMRTFIDCGDALAQRAFLQDLGLEPETDVNEVLQNAYHAALGLDAEARRHKLPDVVDLDAPLLTVAIDIAQELNDMVSANAELLREMEGTGGTDADD